MLERVRATIFVRHYETEGIKFTAGGIIFVWFLSIIYTIYIICSALADNDAFGQPLGIVALTSKYNATIILYSFYATLFICVVITFCDFLVYRANKRIRRKSRCENPNIPTTYSLSANYQLRENIFSMKLILPLDAAYTILNGIYMTGAAILRIHRNEMYVEQYTSIYYIFMTVNLKYFWELFGLDTGIGNELERI
ncbi:unnamed protein product [Meloidogyne enterolobii]|uniref:Uncharacterized protein n=1 Tax=Meloidogyne enterolobii TaxID=390850 RepID=A0ACB0XS33_MELEN